MMQSSYPTNGDVNTTVSDDDTVSTTTANVSPKNLTGWRKDWNDSLPAARATVSSTSVTNPEVIITNYIKKHIVYTVTTQPGNYIVKRRYNDFVWLRDILLASYPGLFIPALPAATATWSNKKNLLTADADSDFVKNRMSQLHSFVQQLKKVSFLTSDTSLHAFTTIADDKEFQVYMEKHTHKDHLESSIGAINWKKMIDGIGASRGSSSNSSSSSTYILDVKRQLEVLKGVLSQIEATVYNCGKACSSFAKQVNHLNVFLGSWNSKEREMSSSSSSSNGASNSNDKAHEWLQGFMYAMDHYSVSSKLNPKIFAVVLLANIQFQLVQIDGFLAFLVAHEKIDIELEKAEQARSIAVEEKNAGSSKGISLKTVFGTNDLAANLRQKEKTVTMLRLKKDMTEKALRFCEIDRFNSERCDIIEKLVASFIAVNVTQAQQNLADWIGTCSKLNINAKDYSHNISLIYASTDDDMFAEP